MCSFDLSQIILNPSTSEIQDISGGNKVNFYDKFPVAILMADSFAHADEVSMMDTIPGALDDLVSVIFKAEMESSWYEYPGKGSVDVDETNRDKKISLLRSRHAAIESSFAPAVKNAGQPKRGLNSFKVSDFPLKDNMADIGGHIVLIGIGDDISIVLTELRRLSKDQSDYRPVVIVYRDEDFLEKQVNIYVANFVMSNIFRLKSECTDVHELINRVNLHSAYSVTLFTSQFSNNLPNDAPELDRDLLILYLHLIRNVPPEVYVATQVVSSDSLTVLKVKAAEHYLTARKLMTPESPLHANFERDMIPYTASDSFVYRQDRKVGIEGIKQGKLRRAKQKKFLGEGHIGSEIFASGRVLTRDSFDALLIQCFFSSVFPKLLSAILYGQKHQITLEALVPPRFVGYSFSDLFRYYMSNQIVILALYRKPNETNEATFCYLYTCPSRETVICEGDRMFMYANLEHQRIIHKKELQKGKGTSHRGGNPLLFSLS